MRELELLAPARNADIGIAAIDCGADAVYIAGPRFGARQAAGNDISDIARLCSHAHMFGAKVFITLNTIIYDDEIDDVRKMMDEIREAGADAIIIQDMAIVEILKEEARKTGSTDSGNPERGGKEDRFHGNGDACFHTMRHQDSGEGKRA